MFKQYPTLIFCQVTLHPNDFTYPCWNGLIQSLNIVYGETFPHTSNFGNKFILGVDVFPAIGCSALFMRSQTFSHTIKFGDCADHVVQFYIIFLFVVFGNLGTMYRCVIILKPLEFRPHSYPIFFNYVPYICHISLLFQYISYLEPIEFKSSRYCYNARQ
jgi:hypothetical protein